jgi:hypothetical protein
MNLEHKCFYCQTSIDDTDEPIVFHDIECCNSYAYSVTENYVKSQEDIVEEIMQLVKQLEKCKEVAISD